MDDLMIGVLVFFAFILASRYMNDRASKKLDQEKKAELVDLFSKGRILGYVIILGSLALYFIGIKTQVLDLWLLMGAYFILIIGYIMVLALNTFKKLVAHEFPKEFIASYVYSTILRILGVIVFMAIVVF